MDTFVSSANLEMGIDGSGARTELGTLTTHMDRTLQKTKRAVNSMEYMYLAIKRIATYTAIFTFFATFAKLVGNIVELQKRQAEVQTLVDMRNKEAAASYRDIMQQLMHLPAYLGNSIELTKGLYEIMSAGVTEPREAFRLLVISAKYAKAGLTDLATAASTLTAVMKAYGLTAEQMREKSDIMFASVMEGKFHADELNDALGKVIPTAAAMGVSIDEVVTALAVLTQRGLDVHEAATGLNRMLLAWMKPLNKSRVEFNKLGLEFGRNAFASMTFGEALAKIVDGTKRYGDLLPNIFTRQRGLRAAFILTGSGLADYDRLLNKVRKSAEDEGEVERAVAKVRRTVAHELEELKNELIKVGQAWLKHSNAVAFTIRIFKDFLITMAKAPAALVGLAVLHKLLTSHVAHHAKTLGALVMARRANAFAIKTEGLSLRAKGALMDAEIAKQTRMVAQVKLLRIGLLSIVAVLITLNELIKRRIARLDEEMDAIVEETTKVYELRKELIYLGRIYEDVYDRSRNYAKEAFGAMTKYAATYIEHLFSVSKNSRKFEMAVLNLLSNILKTDDEMMAWSGSIDSLIESFKKGTFVAEDHLSILRLVGKAMGIQDNIMRQLVNTEKEDENIKQRLLDLNRELTIVMRDYNDIVSARGMPAATMAELFDLEKLQSVRRTIEALMNPDAELLYLLDQAGVELAEISPHLSDIYEEFGKALGIVKQQEFNKAVEEMTRDVVSSFRKFKPEYNDLMILAESVAAGWKEAHGEIGISTKDFVADQKERIKILDINWKFLTDSQKSRLQELVDSLSKTSNAQAKLREKALKGVESWADDYSRVLEDIAKLENELNEEKYKNVYTAMVAQTEIELRKLEEKADAYFKYYENDLIKWAEYIRLKQAMQTRLELAIQASTKRQFDNLTKRLYDSMSDVLETGKQRMEYAKKMYKSFEEYSTEFTNLEGWQLNELEIKWKEFWEHVIIEARKGYNELEELSMALGTIGSLLDEASSGFEKLIEAFQIQAVWAKAVVDAIGLVGEGFDAASDAAMKYSKAQEAAAISETTGNLAKTASIIEFIIKVILLLIDLVILLTKETNKLAMELQQAQLEAENTAAALQNVVDRWKHLGIISERTAEQVFANYLKYLDETIAALLELDSIIQDVGINMYNYQDLWGMLTNLTNFEDWNLMMEDAAGVPDTIANAFEKLIAHAQKFGYEGSKEIITFIRAYQEMGIEIPEINEYIIKQLGTAAEGLNRLMQSISGGLGESRDAVRDLTREKRMLLDRIEQIQRRMATYGAGSAEWEAANAQLQEYLERLGEIDSELMHHQSLLSSIVTATADQLQNLGLITAGVFGAFLSEGVSIIEIFEEMGEAVYILMERYRSMGLEVPEYLQAIFDLYEAFQIDPEFFEGLVGLQQILQGLGNSAYLTADLFAALMEEAKRYWDLLRASQEEGGFGLPDEEAIAMLYPLLQQAWWYAQQYGYQLPQWLQEAIDLAQSLGFIFEAPIENQTLDAILAGNDIMTTGFGEVGDAVWNSVDVLWTIDDSLHALWAGSGTYQHGSPHIGDTQLARLHAGEAVLPENVASALREFFTGGGDITMTGGGAVRANIIVDGRLIYQALVPYLREGSGYGDIEVSGQGVF